MLRAEIEHRLVNSGQLSTYTNLVIGKVRKYWTNLTFYRAELYLEVIGQGGSSTKLYLKVLYRNEQKKPL